MSETIRITNSVCPNLYKYDEKTEAAEDLFKASVDSADIEDTLVVGCPEAGCKLAFELYVYQGRLGRVARAGVFDNPCLKADSYH